MSQYKISLDHICDVVAYVSPPVPVGPSSWGTRLFFPIVGDDGYVDGPKLKGKLLPLGECASLIRIDNCFEEDVRIIIETEDKAMIYSAYRGVVDMTEEQVKKLLSGELPLGLELFTTPRFETAHENYQWLTRIQAVGKGSVEPAGERIKVSYSWYELS
jgi:hypothetical protein